MRDHIKRREIKANPGPTHPASIECFPGYVHAFAYEKDSQLSTNLLLY